VKLIPDWRRAWRFLVVHVLILVGIAPDVHAAVVAMGWLDDPTVPPSFVWTLRALAVLGVAVRLIQQKRKPE
jgi:hypothetical protein